MGSGIWVVVEHDEGEPRNVSLEILSGARSLVDHIGQELTALFLGDRIEGASQKLQGLPDRVLLMEDPLLADYTSDGYVTVIADLAQKGMPLAIMGGATLIGRDFLPRLAARLETGIASEVTGIEIGEDGSIMTERPIHGGRVLVHQHCPDRMPQVISVRPRTFQISEGSREAKVEMVSPDLDPEEIRVERMKKVIEKGHALDLTEADVVVSGGRGMKGPENFHLLEQLAGRLGGVVGASRSVVDSKWRPQEEQVGKSGKTVSPNLYIACGISGAVHHIMGMDSSKVVVAINQDQGAPIFSHADYGIVDDLFQVLPIIIDELGKNSGKA